MIHKFEFKADLHKVYERLAGKENAGMAETDMHRLRNADDLGSIPGASTKDEDEHT